jgi:hypothetical protein
MVWVLSNNWNKKVGDMPFILLVSPRLPLIVSVFLELLVMVCLPILVGFFKASHILLMLCQSVSLFLEDGELYVIGLGVDFILLCNFSQSLCNEDELVSVRAVSFESGTSSLRGEAQLTKICGGHHHLLRDDKSILLIPGSAFAFEEDGDRYNVRV